MDSALFDEDLVLLGEDGVQFLDPFKPKAYRISGPSWVNNHAHVLMAGPSVDWRYLEHYLNAFDYRGLANGTTRLKLTQSAMRQIPIAYPSLDEQGQLVEVLENHLSRVDVGTRYLYAARRRIERLLSTVLWSETHQLPDARVVRLDAIAEVRLGRQRSPKNHSGDRMRPYLRAANVDWNRFRLDDVKEMHFSEAEEVTYRLEEGDILLTEASGSPAEVGKSVLYQGIPAEVCFQNTLLRVRSHDADPAFLQKYLLAEARAGRFMPKSRGVGINHLGRARLAALEIELPGLDEQIAAARRVDEAIGQLERLRDSVQQQERRAEQLRRGLLDAVFSGRLTGDAGIAGIKKEALAG